MSEYAHGSIGEGARDASVGAEVRPSNLQGLRDELASIMRDYNAAKEYITGIRNQASSGLAPSQAWNIWNNLGGRWDSARQGPVSTGGNFSGLSNVLDRLGSLRAAVMIADNKDKVRGQNASLGVFKSLMDDIEEIRTGTTRAASDFLNIQQTIQDQLVGFAANIQQWGAAAASGGLRAKPQNYEGLSPQDKVVVESMNPDLVRYLDSLPASNAVTGAPPPGTTSAAVASGTAGTPSTGTGGAGNGGGTGGTRNAGGNSGATRASGGNATTPIVPPTPPPPPPPPPSPSIGTFNGRPVYDGDRFGTPTSVVGNTTGGGILQFRPTGIEIMPLGVKGDVGLGFTYEALRDGGVDLNQFDGEIKTALNEIKTKLNEEKAAFEKRRQEFQADAPAAPRYDFNSAIAARDTAQGRLREQFSTLAAINPALSRYEEAVMNSWFNGFDVVQDPNTGRASMVQKMPENTYMPDAKKYDLDSFDPSVFIKDAISTSTDYLGRLL